MTTAIPNKVGGQSGYASDAMAARQAVILETARRLLSTGEDFSMKTLATESGVAIATLYNIFGGKDALIAEAVLQVFRERLRPDEAGVRINPIDELEQRTARASAEIMKAPEYARAMLDLYFRAGDDRVSQILHEEAAHDHRLILSTLESHGRLRDGFDTASIADDFTAIQYGVVSNWAAGRISDTALHKRLRQSVLLAYASVCTAEFADSIIARLGYSVD